MNFEINEKCRFILERLENSGFKAYLVGGCVRDMLMGRAVSDFDITTDAMPEDTMSVFSDCHVIPTGIRHGTVTVRYMGESFEITTFRVDGAYSDSRHPDSVKFTADITEDLARRDLTVNAMSMDIKGNIIDPFGGKADIEKRIIRCVGDPEKRFSEDALRILRALRFSSVLGFAIDGDTKNALMKLKNRLDHIAAERIRVELTKLLMGGNAFEVLMEYRDIIGQIIPEITAEFDFEQHTKYHKYDVYEHTLHAMCSVPDEFPYAETLRVTMLLHDIAKPACFTLDENGRGHFKGHAPKGAQMAERVLKRLKFDNHTVDTICTLIAHHDDDVKCEYDTKKLLSTLGAELFFMLINMKKCDNCGKNDFVLEENVGFDRYAEYAKKIIAEGCCLSLKQLAVNGSDLAELGIKGADIGNCLDILLDRVMREELPNERDALLNAVKELER